MLRSHRDVILHDDQDILLEVCTADTNFSYMLEKLNAQIDRAVGEDSWLWKEEELHWPGGKAFGEPNPNFTTAEIKRQWFHLTLEVVRKRAEQGRLDVLPIAKFEERTLQGKDDNVEALRDLLQRVASIAGPAKKKRTTTSTNDARDKWMYIQKKAGKTHGQIKYQLQKLHPDWDQLATDQAVGRAIDRHCKRKSLPPLRRK